MDGAGVLAAIWSPLVTCPRKQGQAQMPGSIHQPGEGRNLCVGLHGGLPQLRSPVHLMDGVTRVRGSKMQDFLRENNLAGL